MAGRGGVGTGTADDLPSRANQMPECADPLSGVPDNMSGAAHILQSGADAMSAIGDAVSGSPDRVPADRDAMPACGDLVPAASDDLSGSGNTMPGASDAVSAQAHDLPGGDNQLPGGADHLPIHGDEVPRGLDHLPDGDFSVPNADHHMPRISDCVPDLCADKDGHEAIGRAAAKLGIGGYRWGHADRGHIRAAAGTVEIRVGNLAILTKLCPGRLISCKLNGVPPASAERWHTICHLLVKAMLSRHGSDSTCGRRKSR